MPDIIVIDSLDKVIQYIQRQLEDAQSELTTIIDKYSAGGMYSNDDASDETYFEGKVTGLEYALWAVKQLEANKEG